jgi:8-amino-7-oxononanoate synthase
MTLLDQFFHDQLHIRKQKNSLRTLYIAGKGVDFCSNDYLGIVHNNLLNNKITPKKMQELRKKICRYM